MDDQAVVPAMDDSTHDRHSRYRPTLNPSTFAPVAFAPKAARRTRTGELLKGTSQKTFCAG
jgi:hypothetical protein